MSNSPSADPNDPRERFKAALEAKKSKGGHRGTEPMSTSGKAKESSGAAGGKKEFRRKSGG
ncbi:MAG: DUF5302 domain-containing protein [Candidatus Nanopelagicales bacterium]|jgi:hypothetical protein